MHRRSKPRLHGTSPAHNLVSGPTCARCCACSCDSCPVCVCVNPVIGVELTGPLHRQCRTPRSRVHMRTLSKDQPIDFRELRMLQGVWSRPGALRPATSPWRAARGTPAEVDGLSNGGAGQKGRLECLGAAGKAANLGGCKSLYRQLLDSDGEHIHCSGR